MPKTAALEHCVRLDMLHMELVTLEGAWIARTPTGQWLKGFAYTSAEAKLSGLASHSGNGPEQQLTHTEGAEAPTKDCREDSISQRHKEVEMAAQLTINSRQIGVVLVLEGLVQQQHVDQYADHQQRRYEAPTEAIILGGFYAQHKLNIAAEALHPVDPTDGEELENGQHESHKGGTKEIQQIEHILPTGCDVDQTQQISYNRNKDHNVPLLLRGKLILEHRRQARDHGHIAANAQHEEHEKEEYREELRYHLELGNGIGIRDESQAGSAIHYTRNIRGIILVRQVAQDAKDDDTREQRSERVQGGYNVGIPAAEREGITREGGGAAGGPNSPVDILAETIVGGVHDNVTKADGKREEHLGDSCIPHLRLQQLMPLRLEEVQDAIDGPRQGESTYK